MYVIALYAFYSFTNPSERQNRLALAFSVKKSVVFLLSTAPRRGAR